MTLGVHDQADDLAIMDIKRLILNQPAVNSGVKPRVVDDVVDVPVHIVVFPTGLDGAKHLERIAGNRGLSLVSHRLIMQVSCELASQPRAPAQSQKSGTAHGRYW